MGRRSKSKRAKPLTPARATAQRNQKIFKAAAVAGLPEAQRDVAALEIAQVPQIGNEPTPIKETVRKLTAIERLKRSGVLEAHEAAACEWYADAHTLGFDTISCTANYEGRGGGGFGPSDLLARYKHQMQARDDYAWARTFIPAGYRTLFDAIVIGQQSIAGAASATSSLKRSQAENRTRLALKLCANLLFDGIKSLLPIDMAPFVPPPKVAAEAPAKSGGSSPAPRSKPTTDAIDAKLDKAMLDGATVAEIHIAKAMADALEAEGHKGTFRGLPLFVRDGWNWGAMLVPPAREEAA